MNSSDQIDGFLVRRVTDLPNLRSTAHELEHQGSGARILHLHNDDAENLFSVTFPTPPPDDTGVPHILEHCVLAGSAKFPVKDPFFEMVKCSMATFINAMTASDHTVYPVASNVRGDFFNLADVYWDAVFHPLLTEQTFAREGHHLELSESGELLIKGIVYNEMKGARSSPEAKVFDLIEKNLWPDTPYGKDSGGDPDHIPELTWQGLRQFHRRFYHPSNAFIVLYGDIPTADHLKFLKPRLDGFKRAAVVPDLPHQPRWSAPRLLKSVYPVAPSDATAGKTFIVLNWLVGSATDTRQLFAFSALERILLGNQAAPLRKAIIDSKLGEDLSHSGYGADGVDAAFHIGIKGSEAQRSDQFVQLVTDTLEQIARQPIAQERFDAAIQQLSYHYLEITPNFPLRLMGTATAMWRHGLDPLILLRAQEHIQQLRKEFAADPQIFGRLIRERILNNPHRLLLIVEPDPQIQARSDDAFARKMAALKSSMSPQQLRHVEQNQEQLDALLNQPNSPEALASLPQLQVRDLPRQPRNIPTTAQPLPGGGTLLVNDVFANGVNYLQVSFDMSGLPAELYPFIPLFGDCVQKMGAAGQDFTAIAQRVAAFTGGVGFSAGIATAVDDPGRLVRRAVFSTKFLDDNTGHALDLLRDLIFETDPSDIPRLRDVLLQERAHQRTRPSNDGLGLALRQAARGLSLEGHLQHITGGLPQIELIEKIATGDVEPLIEKLTAIRRFLLRRAGITASFTGGSSAAATVGDRLAMWATAMDEKPVVDDPLQFSRWTTPPREGLAAPMNVAYCTLVMPAPHISHADAPLLAVGARLLSLGYVLEEVRFKGTAYGGGCTYNGSASQWAFHSYRDPWINRTLDVYGGALPFIRRADWTQADVDRSIIGTAKESERPIRPSWATSTALWRHLVGDTPQRRTARHAAYLAAQLPQVRRALSEQFERHAAAAAVCVVSSREKLDDANRQRSDAPLQVRDILS
jgi:Zn-dependent M16 (insulinase) family peptidase